VLRRWVAAGDGAFAFVELAVFVLVLVVGLAYVWAKGDLAWLRQVREQPPGIALPVAPIAAREKGTE
jgi:NADH-quinone oxidoreductase subunit A